jgi:hypothetical protein
LESEPEPNSWLKRLPMLELSLLEDDNVLPAPQPPTLAAVANTAGSTSHRVQRRALPAEITPSRVIRSFMLVKSVGVPFAAL